MEWIVKDITIRYNDFGRDKGTYKGEIEFCKGKDDSLYKNSFTISLSDKRCKEYFELLKADIKDTADEFVNNLLLETENENE